jgi:hypothetical protein
MHVIKPLSLYEVKFIFTQEVQETESYLYVYPLRTRDTVSQKQNSRLLDAASTIGINLYL